MRLVAPLFKRHGLHADIIQHWPKIAGTSLCEVSAPVALRFPRGAQSGGTLTLSVDPAFALEAHYQIPLILERLKVFLGAQAVTRIQIQQTLYASPPAASTQFYPTPPASLDGDDPLQQALAQLGGQMHASVIKQDA